MFRSVVRVGTAELITLASAAAVGAAVGVAVWSGWWIALVPGLTYALTITAAYLIYRHYRSEAARLQEYPPAGRDVAAEQPAERKAA